jgi:hypothetical protein
VPRTNLKNMDKMSKFEGTVIVSLIVFFVAGMAQKDTIIIILDAI